MTQRAITLVAADGYPLSALLVAPADPPRATVVVSSGTGFPKAYYFDFARAGADAGYAVLLRDDRGIGASIAQDMATLDVRYTDWGRYDAPAALDYLSTHYPDRPMLHVAHSVGGHFIGLWPNHDRITAHALLCVGSGYWAHHDWTSRLRELYFWHGYGPWSLRRRGYVARGGGWRGTDLPRGVFETWKRWCHQRRYFLDEIHSRDDFRGADYGSVTAKMRSWIYTDDPIANPRTASLIPDLYPNAPATVVYRDPAEFGLSRIGHGGPFSARCARAGAEIWRWLAEQL